VSVNLDTHDHAVTVLQPQEKILIKVVNFKHVNSKSVGELSPTQQAHKAPTITCHSAHNQPLQVKPPHNPACVCTVRPFQERFL
jgi:hypothetical protein